MKEELHLLVIDEVAIGQTECVWAHCTDDADYDVFVGDGIKGYRGGHCLDHAWEFHVEGGPVTEYDARLNAVMGPMAVKFPLD